MLYIDVYYTHGWIADKTVQALQKQGWNVSSEWADKFERASLWSHWANDLDYGGATNKGLNSKIVRFIRNSEKDVWNNDPVLGQSAIDEFEGWTGETDWNSFYDNVWQRDLPAKYLQQQKITRWDGNDITFTGGISGTVEDGKRTFYDHGRKVLSGTDYLLPWDGGKKLYHYSQKGGTSSWAVPSKGAYTVYRLTDNGRVKTGTVRPVDGRITLKAEAGQPYVLYPDRAPKAADPKWGEDTLVADPGFNDDRLGDWTRTGTAVRDTDDQGRNSAKLSGSGTAALSQRIGGLKPGARYTASALIEVEPGKTRHTTISMRREVRRRGPLHRQGLRRRFRLARHLLPARQGQLHRPRERPHHPAHRGREGQHGDRPRRRRTPRRQRPRHPEEHRRPRGLRGRRPGLGPLPEG